jgi:hypothetical protein
LNETGPHRKTMIQGNGRPLMTPSLASRLWPVCLSATDREHQLDTDQMTAPAASKIGIFYQGRRVWRIEGSPQREDFARVA